MTTTSPETACLHCGKSIEPNPTSTTGRWLHLDGRYYCEGGYAKTCAEPVVLPPEIEELLATEPDDTEDEDPTECIEVPADFFAVFEVDQHSASFYGLFESDDAAFGAIGRWIVAGGYAGKFKVLPLAVGTPLDEITAQSDWLEP